MGLSWRRTPVDKIIPGPFEAGILGAVSQAIR